MNLPDNSQPSSVFEYAEPKHSINKPWLIILAVVVAVHTGSYFIMDGGWPLLFAMSAALGYLVYSHVSEYHLFVRNLIANEVVEENGWAHAFIARMQLKKFILFILAFVFSGSFLLHANQMPLYIWWLIYVDVFILMFLLKKLYPAIKTSGTKRKFRGLFQRKVVFWINIVVFSLLVAVVSFFMPVADTSNLSILQAGEIAFNEVWQSSSDPVLGFCGGAIASVDAATWNLMQQLSHVEFSTMQKILAWVVFLIIQTIYLWVLQTAILGVLAIHEKKGSLLDRVLGESKASKWGWGVFYSLIIIWLALGIGVDKQQINTSTFSINFIKSTAPEKVVIDPCKDVVQSDKDAVNQTFDQHIAQEKRKYFSTIDHDIDIQVNQAFARAVSGVDSYLEWYFTVAGEWQRLTTAFTGDIGTLMKDKMTQLIINDTGFRNAIQTAQNNVSSHVKEQFTQTTQSVISIAQKQVEIHPCSTNQQIELVLPSLSHDMKRLALTTSTTAAAGAAIAMASGAAITTKLAATASAKMAAKLLAKTAAKTAVKAAGGAAGAGAGFLTGLYCGPYAPFCSTALAVAGFFSVDAVFMEGDELINREDMRRDMVNSLMAQRNQIKTRYKNSYHKAGNEFFSETMNKTHAYFVPAKDGI